MRLLLLGGNRQQRVLAPAVSANTRRHTPEREFHRRQVPSDDADAMKSFAADQSKSEREREKGAMNLCVGASIHNIK